jgi:predicted Zn-dependent protease with MMP-like domain
MPVYATPPTADDIADLAEQALARLPRRLAQRIPNLGIVVDDLPDEAVCLEMALDSPWDLTGLFRAAPASQRPAAEDSPLPGMIHLFRDPILLEWIETGADLSALVRRVLIHEIAQHLGFSEQEIATLAQS